jgi:hypothetical protein
MQATTRRNMHGQLVRETVIPLGFDRRELRVETRKHSFRPFIETSASVVQVSEDGRSYTHRFGMSRVPNPETCDYRKTVTSVQGRATEKALAAQHDVVDFGALKAEAIAFYKPAAIAA